MMVQNSAQSYTQPNIQIGVRQQLSRRSAWELPGGLALWKAFGKIAVVVCLAVGTVQMSMGLYINSRQDVVRQVEDSRHQHMDTNKSLRAQRAALLAPEYVELVAGKALSLHAPKPGQVKHL